MEDVVEYQHCLGRGVFASKQTCGLEIVFEKPKKKKHVTFGEVIVDLLVPINKPFPIYVIIHD